MAVRLLDALRLPWPTPWASLFEPAAEWQGAGGREERSGLVPNPLPLAPLLVEIGFGGGDFLVDLARQRPEANVIGVEISLPSIRRALKKGRQAGLENLLLVQASGRAFLWLLCRPVSLSAIYVNFPDPWPKDRHHDRRLIQDDFLALAASRMVPEAPLEIATDHAEYAEWIAEHLQRAPAFESQSEVIYVTDDPDRLRTKYERIALAEGRTCYYFKWRRNDTPAPIHFPIPPEVPMPHLILKTPLTLDEIEAVFEPQRLAAGDTHVRFIELFRSGSADRLLLETHIAEDPIAQRVGLTIEKRDNDELLVGVHELGFPRPTTGIHQALAFLGAWLLSLNARGRISKSNLQVDVQPDKLNMKDPR